MNPTALALSVLHLASGLVQAQSPKLGWFTIEVMVREIHTSTTNPDLLVGFVGVQHDYVVSG